MTIRFFDTTLRDGLLSPIFKPTIQQECSLLEKLDTAHIDILEIGHAGVSDQDDLKQKISIVKQSNICLLSDLKKEHIHQACQLMEKANTDSVLNLYSNTNILVQDSVDELKHLKQQLKWACQMHPNVQWTAFDANRTRWPLLKDQINCALEAGVHTISIADSMGVSTPNQFASLIKNILQFTPDIDLSVHCHDDLGHALENSLQAIQWGAQQIEVSLKGVGARKGNCDIHLAAQNIDKTHIDINALKISECAIESILNK